MIRKLFFPIVFWCISIIWRHGPSHTKTHNPVSSADLCGHHNLGARSLHYGLRLVFIFIPWLYVPELWSAKRHLTVKAPVINSDRPIVLNFLQVFILHPSAFLI